MEQSVQQHHHDSYNCVDQKLIRSDQFVNFDAKVKVRTRVRLLDVDIEADCVCIPERYSHGTANQKYIQVEQKATLERPKITPSTVPTPERKVQLTATQYATQTKPDTPQRPSIGGKQI